MAGQCAPPPPSRERGPAGRCPPLTSPLLTAELAPPNDEDDGGELEPAAALAAALGGGADGAVGGAGGGEASGEIKWDIDLGVLYGGGDAESASDAAGERACVPGICRRPVSSALGCDGSELTQRTHAPHGQHRIAPSSPHHVAALM